MNNSEDTFSERTLRYGRNINFLCFIALGMSLMNVNLDNANLFGARTSELNIWIVLLILISYHFITFQYLGRIDFNIWKKNVPFVDVSFNQQKQMHLSQDRIEIYHWSLFFKKEKITKLFLKKDHSAVTQYNKPPSNNYGWMVYNNSGDALEREAFAINIAMFDLYKVTYKRWLYLEWGLPTLLTVCTFFALIYEISEAVHCD